MGRVIWTHGNVRTSMSMEHLVKHAGRYSDAIERGEIVDSWTDETLTHADIDFWRNEYEHDVSDYYTTVEYGGE